MQDSDVVFEYSGRFGAATYKVYDAVELVDDGGAVHRCGIVTRVNETCLGWRYDVSMLTGRAVAGPKNLRSLSDPYQVELQQSMGVRRSGEGADAGGAL